MVDGVPVPVGVTGYLGEGEPEGFLVEVVGTGCVDGEVGHPVPAGVEGPAASLVVPVLLPQYRQVPAAVRIRLESGIGRSETWVKRVAETRGSDPALYPESTERSGEGAGTGHHRDGEETVPADMGRAGPTVACCR